MSDWLLRKEKTTDGLAEDTFRHKTDVCAYAVRLFVTIHSFVATVCAECSVLSPCTSSLTSGAVLNEQRN
jgi:hypothetical protein